MVRAARIAVGDGRHAKVLQWRHPLLKNMIHRSVALGIDTANLARPIVDIEVSRYELLLGLESERPRGLPHKLGQLHLLRSGRKREATEMLSGVSLAPEEPLLFARPEGNADRSPRFDRKRVQNAHDLHRDYRACPVIRSAGTGDPAIQ